ncbi:hypothetical protein BpHYR1_022832 [Brachionus plicatilis]|uniref:Uncharacterized protein n=1 Tax=Brachionus plicatilis TaxID=10195 RepID=A0A3M7QGG0_BRAPC|nr:hypothetical protein BpHYR1_022832 [Brachionus plicatilis]
MARVPSDEQLANLWFEFKLSLLQFKFEILGFKMLDMLLKLFSFREKLSLISKFNEMESTLAALLFVLDRFCKL